MLALIPRALIGLVALFAGLALFSPPEASDSAVWGGGTALHSLGLRRLDAHRRRRPGNQHPGNLGPESRQDPLLRN